MKILSTSAKSLADNPMVSVCRLVSVTYDDGYILYMCDTVWGIGSGFCRFNNQYWAPMVLRFESISCGAIDTTTLADTVSETRITIDNTVPVGGYDHITAMFMAKDPRAATWRIFEVYSPEMAASGDEITIFNGVCEDIQEIIPAGITLLLSGIEGTIDRRLSTEIVTSDDWPGADPDDIGRMLPIVYGSAKKVPFLALDAGGISTLVYNITAQATNIVVSDPSVFPASGMGQIDYEFFTWSGKSGNTLIGCVRGVNSTALTHSTGSAVAEVQTSYVYAIGSTAHSIGNIYVYDHAKKQFLRQYGNYTAYTGQYGDQLDGYGYRAVVEFHTPPTIFRQVGLSIDDSIAFELSDSPFICHSISSNINTPIIFTESTSNYKLVDYEPAYFSPQYSIFSSAGSCCAEIDMQISVSLQAVSSGDVQITLESGLIPSQIIYKKHAISPTQTINETSMISFSSGIDHSYTVPNTYPVMHVYMPTFVGNVIVKILSFRYVFPSYMFETTKTGAVVMNGNSVADTVIGGRVYADIIGIPDDTSGTYTGTPRAAIQSPVSISKHILMGQCGLPPTAIDTDSYATAAIAHTAAGVGVMSVVIDEPVRVRDILRDIATQCASGQCFESGKHRIVYMGGGGSPDLRISPDRVDINQLWVSYSDRNRIRNKMTARYLFETGREIEGYSVDAFRASVTLSDTASISLYGLAYDTIDMEFIRGVSHANTVLVWMLSRLAAAKNIVKFQGGHYLQALERYDRISFYSNTTLSSFADNEFSGAWAGNIVAGDWEHYVDSDSIDSTDPMTMAFCGTSTPSDVYWIYDKKIMPDGVILLEAIKK